MCVLGDDEVFELSVVFDPKTRCEPMSSESIQKESIVEEKPVIPTTPIQDTVEEATEVRVKSSC